MVEARFVPVGIRQVWRVCVCYWYYGSWPSPGVHSIGRFRMVRARSIVYCGMFSIRPDLLGPAGGVSVCFHRKQYCCPTPLDTAVYSPSPTIRYP
jgi:hypothetical protein